MINPPNVNRSGLLQPNVDSAAQALKSAESSAYELSHEASEALSAATDEIARLAESLRTHAVDAAKDAALYAKHQVEAHPMASLAAALTAVVAVMGVVAVNRRGKPDVR